MNQLSIGIRSDLGDVSLVAVALHAVCSHLGLNETKASEVELCLVEALTNVIRHGYNGEADHRVEISLAAEAAQLRIEIWDEGTPIEAVHLERLMAQGAAAESDGGGESLLTSLAEGGRGLQIIHDLMDEVSYSQAEGRNQLVLIKHLPSDALDATQLST